MYTAKTTVSNVHSAAITSTATSKAAVSDAAFTLAGRSIGSSSKSFSGVVATGTDYESGRSFTITWADGSTSSGSGPTSTGNGGFGVSGSHSYATTSTKTITMAVKDSKGQAATAQSTLNIGGT